MHGEADVYSYCWIFEIFCHFFAKQQVVSIWIRCVVYAQDTQKQRLPEGEWKNMDFNS